MPLFKINDHKKLKPAVSRQSKYIELCGDQKAVSLLQHSIRAVQIDCCFRFANTKWGHIDNASSGVIFIDLTIQQPEDCTLTNALTTITLTPADSKTSKAESEAQKKNETTKGDPISRPVPSSSSLEITEFYGPKAIYGKPREASYSTKYRFQPDISAPFVTIGGVGAEYTKESTDTRRWKFVGWRRGVVCEDDLTFRTRGRYKENSRSTDDTKVEKTRSTHPAAKYRQIFWRLEENQDETQVSRSPTLHTAFAFEHGNKPFFLDVEFEGKLRHRHHRALERLVFPPKKKKANARAKIDAEKLSRGFNEDLKSIALGLDETMVETNNRSQGKVIREPEQFERTATPTQTPIPGSQDATKSQPQMSHTAARSPSTTESHGQTSRNDILAISRQLLNLEEVKAEETKVETPLSNGSITTTKTTPKPEQTSTESITKKNESKYSLVLSIAHYVSIYWATVATWLAFVQKLLNN